jgi:putative flippase GtrA
VSEERSATDRRGRQFGRYLAVGMVNTAFGYGSYAILTALLTPHLRAGYMYASAISSVLGITFSFLTYKWFVFRTRGNYLREWGRCFVVYGGTILIGLALLPVLVTLVELAIDEKWLAPYLAGALVLATQVVSGFIGHRKYSFRQRN